jgi:hypothetical protein
MTESQFVTTDKRLFSLNEHGLCLLSLDGGESTLVETPMCSAVPSDDRALDQGHVSFTTLCGLILSPVWSEHHFPPHS